MSTNNTSEYTLNLILEKIERLEHEYINLERKIEQMSANTQRMENHIDFVEATYRRIKTPFNKLMNVMWYLPFYKSPITEKKETSEGPNGLKGPEGPEGPEGPKGLEGPKGPKGPLETKEKKSSDSDESLDAVLMY